MALASTEHSRRGVGVVGLASGLLVAVPAVAALLLWLPGSNDAAAELGLPDPGALTTWGLPAMRAVRDLTAALTIGALVLASTAVAPGSRADRPLGRNRAGLIDIASGAGVLWVTSSVGVLVLSYSDLAGKNALLLGFGEVQFFVTGFALGKALALSSALAALSVVLMLTARRVSFVGLATLVAIAALWPLATTGHAAGSSNHDVAVNAQAGHLLGVSIWFGGLGALALTRRSLGPDLPAAAARFSYLAGWSFGLVVLSGVAAASLRVGEWGNLASTYGAILALKVVALSALGVAGYVHRRRALPRLSGDGSGRTFARLVVVELAIMAVAMGAGVALGRTPPPSGGEEQLTTAQELLGYAMPPPLSGWTFLTQWRIDSMITPIAALAVIWYLIAVRRLHRRGDRWRLGRTLSWVSGWAVVFWATSGSPGVYGDVLFSMHMVQHMTVATTAPILLVLGAPVTLALRTIPKRNDRSRGPREWLLVLVNSKVSHVLGSPLVSAGLFVSSLVVFYYSGLFELSMRSHTAHLVMIAHFLITGYLFASTICGIDPGPKRPAYPFRMLLLMVTFGFHALFAVSLMSSTQVLAGDWFRSLQRPWGATLADDQYAGASLGWLMGDYPLAILAGAMVWGWVRSDQRLAARYERKAQRDGHQELEAYNEYLQRLSAASRESEDRP